MMVLGMRLAGPSSGLLRRTTLVGVWTWSGSLRHLVSTVEWVGRVEVARGIVTLAGIVDTVRIHPWHWLGGWQNARQRE